MIMPPKWLEKNYRPYLKKTGEPDNWEEREHLPVDTWLNAVRWTDDTIKEIILGFRERGLENETLFLMYTSLPFNDQEH
jgi:phosphoglycerol transferase MdoB-like AlkP superfamily enzyme